MITEHVSTTKVSSLLAQLTTAIEPVLRAADSYAHQQKAFDLPFDTDRDHEITTRLDKTIFLVEATSEEIQTLWEKWALEARDLDAVALLNALHNIQNDSGANAAVVNLATDALSAYQRKRASHRVIWKQMNPGYSLQVGELAGLPVWISLTWVRLNSQVVLFYESTSRVTDHAMVEAWLFKRCLPKWDNGTREARTNAANFSHCISAVREANNRKEAA